MTIAVHERTRCSAGCFSTSEGRRVQELEESVAFWKAQDTTWARVDQERMRTIRGLEAENEHLRAELKKANEIVERVLREEIKRAAVVTVDPKAREAELAEHDALPRRRHRLEPRPGLDLRGHLVGDYRGVERTDEPGNYTGVVWVFECMLCGERIKLSTGEVSAVRRGARKRPRCPCQVEDTLDCAKSQTGPECESAHASDAADDQFVFGSEPEGPPPAPVVRDLPPEPPEPGTRRRGRPPKREPSEFESEDNPERGDIAPIDEALDELAAGDVDELPSVRQQDEHTFTRLRDRFADETEDEDDGLDDVNTGARVLPYLPDAGPVAPARHDERPVELLDEDELLDEAMRLFREERALG